MKRLILIVGYAISITCSAQDAKSIFNPTQPNLHWMGVDFSHVKLTGDFSQFIEWGQKNTGEIRNKLFPAWNYLFISEPRKYDIKGMLRDDNITFDIDEVMKINAETKLDDIESTTAPNYTTEQVQTFVNQYKTENKQGIGLVFIADCLNKYLESATYHIVFFNLKDKKIILHEKLTGKASGIGLKNYWAATLSRVIKDIRANRYKEWKSKYK